MAHDDDGGRRREREKDSKTEREKYDREINDYPEVGLLTPTDR